jgi:hypothetical protein
MKSQGWKVAVLAAPLLAAGGTALEAQHPVEHQEFMVANLRERGQPVIPLFDGHFPNPDGSHTLCFGYMSLNLAEIVEIPLGENNFIEPAQFNGGQPTTFLPVPPPPNRYRRFFCTFTVRVPKDFGTQRVVWTLKQDGATLTVPGHLASSSYQLEEQIQRSRGSVAPVVKFLPKGPEGVGRGGDLKTAMTARVGQPLTLSIAVTRPAGIEDMEVQDEGGDGRAAPGPRREWWVKWAKHQGPGEVIFGPDELDVFPGKPEATTTATFRAPGKYVLRLQAIDSPAEGGSYQFHCCWTNAYVTVNVTK